MPYLEIKLGPDTMLLRFVGRIDYVFGRLPRADVQLRDMKVSRLHSQLFLDSRGSAFARDLGSSTGTIVGRRRLKKGAIAPLADGVKLKIGGARIIYRDAQPPTNALRPPGRSGPRGLIRTNARDRHFEADATVLAVEKVNDEGRAGPAEPPPEVDAAYFAAGAEAPPDKPGVEVGIVEAPWDRPGDTASARDGKVSLKPGPKQMPEPPPPPTADYDETGQVEPEPPATVVDDTGEARLLPEDTADLTPEEAMEQEVVEDAGEAFRKPAEFRAAPPGDPEEDAPPPGLPTVRLEKPKVEELQQAAEKVKPAKNKIPTTRLDKASIEERRLQQEEEDVAPLIGKPISADDMDGQKFGWETGDAPASELEMTRHLGGSAPGEYEEVDFGGGRDDDEAEEEEVRFGKAARINLNADESIDIEDDPDSTREPAMESGENLPAEDDDEQDETHPPPARQGATPDRAFKPRKTRKLMKHRPETGKIIDKKPPEGEESALVTDQPITQGDDTVFVPKPGDKTTGKPRRHAENRERTAEDYARGPGGDTMALPADVLKEMRDELKEGEKKPATKDESPPVKDAEDENDFMAETEDLPARKKRPNDDTVVE